MKADLNLHVVQVRCHEDGITWSDTPGVSIFYASGACMIRKPGNAHTAKTRVFGRKSEY